MYLNKLYAVIHGIIHDQPYTEQQRRADIAWLRSMYEINVPNVGTIGHLG